jgi:hypothetical protein
MSDELQRAARAAFHALRSVIADRQGITTELLEDIASKLESVLEPPREGVQEVTVRLLAEHFERLSVLGPPGDVLEALADHAQQGVYRPGAWERRWLAQVFGTEWTAELEQDPNAPYFQRRRRQS